MHMHARLPKTMPTMWWPDARLNTSLATIDGLWIALVALEAVLLTTVLLARMAHMLRSRRSKNRGRVLSVSVSTLPS